MRTLFTVLFSFLFLLLPFAFISYQGAALFKSAKPIFPSLEGPDGIRAALAEAHTALDSLNIKLEELEAVFPRGQAPEGRAPDQAACASIRAAAAAAEGRVQMLEAMLQRLQTKATFANPLYQQHQNAQQPGDAAQGELFSFARCRRTGDVFDRICQLDNVCWDTQAREWVFFEDPFKPLQMIAAEMGTVPLRSLSPLVYLRREEATILVPLPLRYEFGPLPKAAVFHNKSVHVLFEMFWAENFGHALGDDILPAFALMREFDAVSLDVQLLTLNDCCKRMWGAEYARGRGFLELLTSLVSNNLLVEMAVNGPFVSSGPPFVCVNRLLVGHSRLGLSADRGEAWPDLISLIMQRAAQRWNEVKAAASAPLTEQLIVVLEKEGRRRVLNSKELAVSMQSVFNVSVVSVDPGSLSLASQIKIAQRATVIVSPCGGISFFTSFMRPHTATVIVGYWDPISGRSKNMEEFFWRWLPHRNDLYYDVEEKDITILPPGNTTHPMPMDFRNFGAVTVQLPRMLEIVAAALHSSEVTLGLGRESFVTYNPCEDDNGTIVPCEDGSRD